MPASLSRMQVFLLCCLGAVLVVLQLDTGTSNSIDLAHNYVLALRIAQDWHLAPGDITMGEMNFYPAGSHTIAALVGMLFKSTFIGLQATAFAAVALAWGALLWLLNTLERRTALAASALLAVLLWANHAFLGLDLHGAEIMGNFFYPQMVAQALALLAIAIAVRLDAGAPRAAVALFLVAAIYCVARVHLLPALELLGMLCGLALLHVLVLPRAARTRGALGAALAVAGGLAAVLFNPAFAAMRKISEINGTLNLVLLSSKPALVLLCLAVLGAALFLLWMWQRDRIGARTLAFLAAYGGSIALLCLLQLVLLQFGLGSDYAVKKYAFGLSSFLFISVAIVLGRLLAARAAAAAPLPGLAPGLVALVALAVAFTHCTRWVKQNDNSDAVAIERQLLAMQNSRLGTPPAGKANVVVDLKDQSWTTNYLFSIALARTPRQLAMDHVLHSNELGALDQYHTIISTRNASRYGFTDCDRAGSGPLVMLDAACVAKTIEAGKQCKRVVDFSERGKIVPFMLSGFSWPEPDKRWTEAATARFSCVPAERFTTATLTLSPFLGGRHQHQRLAVSVNGGAPVRVDFQDSAELREVKLPLPQVAAGTPLVFTFELPDAASPKELGLSGDARRLGVALRSLSFDQAP